MGLWNRVFAAAYDPFLAGAEKKGIASARRDLLRAARGRVLEIGAGTGLNVDHYPAGIELVLTEPDPHMAKRLRVRAGDREVISAGAERLPFEDASFDTVVSTLVLCTVRDVGKALREIRRVLRPGGQLLFLEHVRAEPGSRLARWQDRAHRPWRAIAAGCTCNRDLLDMLSVESFEIVELRREAWRFMPAIVRPVVIGAAQASS
jgi:ubiquinone/menaquinone biosynthesis C-methylase UbiE